MTIQFYIDSIARFNYVDSGLPNIPRLFDVAWWHLVWCDVRFIDPVASAIGAFGGRATDVACYFSIVLSAAHLVNNTKKRQNHLEMSDGQQFVALSRFHIKSDMKL